MKASINELKSMHWRMRTCARMLRRIGYADKAKEMFGAAKMLKTWIVGIQEEQKGVE